MKQPKLGDFLLWKNDLAKIIGIAEGRQALIEMIDLPHCPHCNGELSPHQFSVIISSHLFKECAQSVPTIGQ